MLILGSYLGGCSSSQKTRVPGPSYPPWQFGSLKHTKAVREVAVPSPFALCGRLITHTSVTERPDASPRVSRTGQAAGPPTVRALPSSVTREKEANGHALTQRGPCRRVPALPRLSWGLPGAWAPPALPLGLADCLTRSLFAEGSRGTLLCGSVFLSPPPTSFSLMFLLALEIEMVQNCSLQEKLLMVVEVRKMSTWGQQTT